MAGCLALALVLAARARADCASPSLVAFASSRATRAETRVFEAEQAVVTRGACVTRRGRREAWFALGDDGSAGALRDKYCGGGGSRATLAHNGTRGSAVGGVRDLSFKAVRPYAAATAEGAQRWRLYKRCAPLRRGRPPASEHLELLPATAAQAAAAAGAEWVPGPVATDRGAAPPWAEIKSSTRLQCHWTVSTPVFLLCFENATRAIDSSKHQPNRLRFHRAREV